MRSVWYRHINTCYDTRESCLEKKKKNNWKRGLLIYKKITKVWQVTLKIGGV